MIWQEYEVSGKRIGSQAKTQRKSTLKEYEFNQPLQDLKETVN